MVDTPTAITTKEQLLSEISNIIKVMMPEITDKAKAGIEDGLKRLFSSGLEAEKKTEAKAVSDIINAQAKALEALRKELVEATEEIATKKKDTMTAYTDAFADWSKAMNQPKLAMVFTALPDLQKHMDEIIAAGKAVKARQDIVVNAPKLITALLSEAIGIMILVVLIMQMFE